jgi:hypothetical protein
MNSHIPRKASAATIHVWPGILIHIMLMVQCPGMGMPLDIERQR